MIVIHYELGDNPHEVCEIADDGTKRSIALCSSRAYATRVYMALNLTKHAVDLLIDDGDLTPSDGARVAGDEMA